MSDNGDDHSASDDEHITDEEWSADDESDFDSEAEAERATQAGDERDILQPLPAALAARVPPEIENNILDLVSTWPELWLDMRLVCTAFGNHIEERAKTKWMRKSDLTFLSSCWKFQRVENDGTAVFRDDDCKDSFKEQCVKNCMREGRPAVVLGHEAFLLDLPGIVYDWNNLSARVPWRNVVVTVMAERGAVRQEMKKETFQRMCMAVRARHEMDTGRMSLEYGFQSALMGLVKGFHASYEAVHKRRYGKAQKRDVEHIKNLRNAIGWTSLNSDEEE